MTTPIIETPSAAGAMLNGPVMKGRWPTIIGGFLTLAMTIGVVRALLVHGVAGLSTALPDSVFFYLAFAVLYAASPIGDYVIFRRLWAIPPSGLTALFKKRIANDVLVGYSGEAYFYAWARQRTTMVAAPFGAVKDVSILSAIAGNVVTLAIVLLALPFANGLIGPDEFRVLAASAAVVIAISLPFLIFSRRVFSLARPLLWWIFLIHILRLVVSSVMLAVAWHFAMPAVSLGMWLLLSAGRMLASRLPLVPNKDLLFANFAILLIGQGQQTANLVAVTAALTLVVHVVLMAVFGVLDVLRNR